MGEGVGKIEKGDGLGSQGCHQKVIAPRGVYLTELVEPCGALPRKCLFIYGFGLELELGKTGWSKGILGGGEWAVRELWIY
jgi:hypothetical protein